MSEQGTISDVAINKAMRLRTFDELEPAEQVKHLKSILDVARKDIRRLHHEVALLKQHEHGASGKCLVMPSNYLLDDRDW